MSLLIRPFRRFYTSAANLGRRCYELMCLTFSDETRHAAKITLFFLLLFKVNNVLGKKKT